MSYETKHTKEFRLKVVHYALENNISEASSIFGLNRATISRWLKNFKADGENSLSNKSRVRQNHPAIRSLLNLKWK
jgi:transposase-like protein